MNRLKAKLIELMLRNHDFMLVDRDGDNGCVLTQADEEGRKHLGAIFALAMRDGQEEVKEIILNSAEEYLKPLEIESRNFIERIK